MYAEKCQEQEQASHAVLQQSHVITAMCVACALNNDEEQNESEKQHMNMIVNLRVIGMRSGGGGTMMVGLKQCTCAGWITYFRYAVLLIMSPLANLTRFVRFRHIAMAAAGYGQLIGVRTMSLWRARTHTHTHARTHAQLSATYRHWCAFEKMSRLRNRALAL